MLQTRLSHVDHYTHICTHAHTYRYVRRLCRPFPFCLPDTHATACSPTHLEVPTALLLALHHARQFIQEVRKGAAQRVLKPVTHQRSRMSHGRGLMSGDTQLLGNPSSARWHAKPCGLDTFPWATPACRSAFLLPPSPLGLLILRCVLALTRPYPHSPGPREAHSRFRPRAAIQCRLAHRR